MRKDLMVSGMITVLFLGLLLAVPVLSRGQQSGSTGAQNVEQDRQAVHQDAQNIQKDRKDIEQDRQAIGQDEGKIQKDRQNVSGDEQNLTKDRSQTAADRKNLQDAMKSGDQTKIQQARGAPAKITRTSAVTRAISTVTSRACALTVVACGTMSAIWVRTDRISTMTDRACALTGRI